ncbi:hypothetical protein RvY_05716 [Ramazzottius varieornatus]|uniref:Uncharacterized protein n=1 Tax=Ramazzottius varieornatus TaxID=947166 RepID=A0A1D1V502_RAMVA|nr:hypothetical protein RvY_05716 [Ramazzottius varieornatus]
MGQQLPRIWRRLFRYSKYGAYRVKFYLGLLKLLLQGAILAFRSLAVHTGIRQVRHFYTQLHWALLQGGDAK